MVTWSKFHTEDPHILGATTQKFIRPGDLVRGICAPLAWVRVICLHKLENAVHLYRLIHHLVHTAFSQNKSSSKALLNLDGHTSHCSFPVMILNASDDVIMCVPSLYICHAAFGELHFWAPEKIIIEQKLGWSITHNEYSVLTRAQKALKDKSKEKVPTQGVWGERWSRSTYF